MENMMKTSHNEPPTEDNNAVPNRAPPLVAQNNFGFSKRELWSPENQMPVDGEKHNS